MTIVEFIKQEMIKQNLTYEQLASSVGMSRQNLWDKLNKRVQPNFGNTKKILEGLGYSIGITGVKEVQDQKADFEEFSKIAEVEQVSYDCIETLLHTMGYEIHLDNETHKNV